jgi:hypothetical protein
MTGQFDGDGGRVPWYLRAVYWASQRVVAFLERLGIR